MPKNLKSKEVTGHFSNGMSGVKVKALCFVKAVFRIEYRMQLLGKILRLRQVGCTQFHDECMLYLVLKGKCFSASLFL
jgi:hypothetical protein